MTTAKTTLNEQVQPLNSNETIYFEDLAEGMNAKISNLITDKDIVMFSQVSGDANPIHLCDDYAAGTQFKTRIAHGSLCASFISAALGTELPGPGSIYVNQNLRFKAPVRIGDEVVTNVTIKNKTSKNNLVEIATQCIVKDTVVLDGEALLLVPSRPIEESNIQ